ncbi:MAG: transcription antitermination protein NusB [Rhodospirillales bacterium]|nr:transcription antitermination protein NusB [Rhodospirillales bacterium]MCB9995508.1 transcription antitermination protein NusB [Rhodospirillales bacterium]
MTRAKASESSQIARYSAARLAAVQAIYQQKSTDQSISSLIEEYKAYRLGQPVDDQAMVLPDGVLFEKIVRGVADRKEDLRGIVDTFYGAQKDVKVIDSALSVEPLLDSILLCGTYELMAHHETDAPIIISDYINVAHAFYEGGEPRLINGLLDKIRQALREA